MLLFLLSCAAEPRFPADAMLTLSSAQHPDGVDFEMGFQVSGAETDWSCPVPGNHTLTLYGGEAGEVVEEGSWEMWEKDDWLLDRGVCTSTEWGWSTPPHTLSSTRLELRLDERVGVMEAAIGPGSGFSLVSPEPGTTLRPGDEIRYRLPPELVGAVTAEDLDASPGWFDVCTAGTEGAVRLEEDVAVITVGPLTTDPGICQAVITYEYDEVELLECTFARCGFSHRNVMSRVDTFPASP